MAYEANLEAKAKKYAQSKGLQLIKFTSPSTAGVPDRILLGKHTIAFIEFKSKGKKPSKLQNYWLKKLEKFGFISGYVDNYDDAVQLIDQALDSKGPPKENCRFLRL